MQWLWNTFLELSANRGNNGFGPGPITYLELEAWCKLTQTALAPNEVSVIKRLDAIFLTVMASKK